MSSASFFGDMLQAITDRGRRILTRERRGRLSERYPTMEVACEALLSSRGEASGIALAEDILARWRALDADGRKAFALTLLTRFSADETRLGQAIEAYRAEPGEATLAELHAAAEPRRQEIIRRLNLAPGGTATLVKMRESVLAMRAEAPELRPVDADFAHLLASWFNRGFLVLSPITWSTPANILEKIIRYEAVHHIGGWDELRSRLAPEDRRCFAFFHPQLPDDPLIFVEIALTRSVPAAIDEVLSEDRAPIAADEATTAVFYSISNCQMGLTGISFGNFLIKQVMEDLRRDLPRLERFVTLSPLPSFARWVAGQRADPAAALLAPATLARLETLDDPAWHEDPAKVAEIEPALSRAAARFLTEARDARGRVIDPVARFHLGNGARLDRINFLADRSERALGEAHGMMVNYLYEIADVEANHEAFVARSEVIASQRVRRLVSGESSAAA